MDNIGNPVNLYYNSDISNQQGIAVRAANGKFSTVEVNAKGYVDFY